MINGPSSSEEQSVYPPIKIGEDVLAWGMGEVVQSRSPSHEVGSLVWGVTYWREYSVMQGKMANPIK
jgi:NADPH-dependent curcumin reductase CurA